MFCPVCRCEFEEGFTHCAECNADLVDELPPEDEAEFVDLVTIMSAPDENIVMVVKSVLEAAGIRCFAKGEIVQDLFALVRAGGGFNPITGPVEIQVPLEDAQAARELLQADERIE